MTPSQDSLDSWRERAVVNDLLANYHKCWRWSRLYLRLGLHIRRPDGFNLPSISHENMVTLKM